MSDNTPVYYYTDPFGVKLSLTTNSSFEALEEALRHGERYGNPYPTSPTRPKAPSDKATPDEFRKYATALEQYEVAEQLYTREMGYYREEVGRIYAVWKAKLRNEIAPEFSATLFDVVYGEAYDRGHSGGYDEVRCVLESMVVFASRIIAAFESDVTAEAAAVRGGRA